MNQGFRNKLLLSLLCSLIYVFTQAQGTRIDFGTIPKSGTVLIFAHQDDDLIWMLPFWKITEKFIGGAMPPTPSFSNVIRQQQTYLNNNGYNIAYESNWITPWSMITHSEYDAYYWDNKSDYAYLADDHLIAFWDDNDNALVRKEVNRIKAKIEQYIASDDVSRIITHNNWGEYGHQHHKAVNKAVRELAVKYRKDVWMLGCNNSNFVDVTVPNGITYTYGSFNTPDLFTSIRAIYKTNFCWSWTNLVPSGDHKFIKVVDKGADKSNILTGESITTTGPSQLVSNAYIFDGVDDYLTLQGNNSSPFTILMRIRPDQIKRMDISMMAEYPSSGKYDRNFYLNDDGRVTARIYDGNSKAITSTTALSSGTWTYIAITGSGSNLKLYINGSLEKTISTGTAITNYSIPELVLGRAVMTDSYFKGQISDVRLYDRALSDDEIAKLGGSGTKYDINASAGTGGNINPSGTLKISSGSNITFNITPSNGYKISDVLVDNVSVGAVSSYTFKSITRSHSISVTFLRLTYSINASSGTGGNISPEGMITVNFGTNRTFNLTVDKGYRIADLIVDNASVGAVESYTFRNITSNHTIFSKFEVTTFNIASNAGKNGTISPSGIISADYGTNQTFTIEANKGFQIDEVIADSNSLGALSKYTFAEITSDHTISATFLPITFTITGNSGSGGSINPSGKIKVNYGNDQHFNITPDNGYKISSIMVDYLPVSIASNGFYLTNIIQDHILSVTFSKLRNLTIIAGAGKNGSISPSGETLVTEGSDISYTITPSPGYRISTVFIDTIPIGPVSEFTFNDISGDHSISAIFTTSIKLDIYPNPFRGEFYIIIRSPYDQVYKISLVTMGNRTVFVYPEIPANTTVSLRPEIPPGLYILNVYLKGKKISSARVIKY